MSLKKILFFSIILASIFVVNNLIHSIFALWQKNDLIVVAKQNLEKQEKENRELKTKLADVKKPEFVEEEARNRLFMTKTGEGVIVLPKDYLAATNSSKDRKDFSKPNWQQWWEVFF